MKNFNTMADDYHTSQSNLIADTANPTNIQTPAESQQFGAARGQQLGAERQVSRHLVDEMSQDLTYLSRDAPLDGGESTFGAATSMSQLAGSGSQREESVLHMGSDLQDPDQEQEDNYLIDRQQTPTFTHNELALQQQVPDNVDIRKPLQQTG